MKKPVYIGVDIGGTKISAGIVGQEGQLLCQKKCQTPQKATSSKIYQAIKTLIGALMKEALKQDVYFVGIGVGIPGIVKPNHTEILITPNTNLSRFPLGKKLEKDFGVKVILENDVNLGLLGEKWLGVAKDVSHVVGLFPGTGVGGAIIIEGKLVSGSHGAAGELGHMIIDYNSRKESAGIHGSLEALASRRAIEREIWLAVKKKKKSIVKNLVKEKNGLIKSSIIAEAIRQKDPDVLRIIDDVCVVLGRACISLRHILNPDMIVFGGGLIEACGKYILPKVKRISAADPFFKGIDRCQIVPSQLGDFAVIFGAVALLLQDMKGHAASTRETGIDIHLAEDNGIIINEQKYKRSITIRADGKVKIVKKSPSFDEKVFSPGINLELLRKICKKNPQLLIIGYKKAKITVSKEARQYLKEKAIQLIQLSFPQAIQRYQNSSCRKTLFLHYPSPAPKRA